MRIHAIAVLIGLISGLCCLPVAAAASVVRIGGTGAAYPVLERLIAEFQHGEPGIRVELVKPATGSGAGVRAVLQGNFDMAISGRHLSDSESGQLAEKDWTASPLAFVINGDVGIKNLTRGELGRIYRGEKLQWPDGTPIRLILRPASDSDTRLIRTLAPEVDEAVTRAMSRSGMVIATHDLENAEILAKAKGVFGTITLCQLRSQRMDFQPLTLEGIAPAIATQRAGSYPMIKPFLIVTRKKILPATGQFIEFLHSPAARHILLQNDCTAVKP